MEQELIRQNVLSLDFWQDTVTYADNNGEWGEIRFDLETLEK